MDELLSKLDEFVKQDNKPLNFIEAANYLNISTSYLYKLTHLRKIPYYKPLGKKIYFLKSELKEFVLQNKLRSRSEMEKDADNYILSKRKV